MGLGQSLYSLEPDIVTVAGVAGAWIAQPHNQCKLAHELDFRRV